jgi:hypothetical protein
MTKKYVYAVLINNHELYNVFKDKNSALQTALECEFKMNMLNVLDEYELQESEDGDDENEFAHCKYDSVEYRNYKRLFLKIKQKIIDDAFMCRWIRAKAAYFYRYPYACRSRIRIKAYLTS